MSLHWISDSHIKPTISSSEVPSFCWIITSFQVRAAPVCWKPSAPHHGCRVTLTLWLTKSQSFPSCPSFYLPKKRNLSLFRWTFECVQLRPLWIDPKLQTAQQRSNRAQAWTQEGWKRWGCVLGWRWRRVWFAWTIVLHKFGCFFLARALLAIYFHSGWLWRAVNSLCSEETQRRFCATAAPYSSCNACKTNLIGRLCHFDVGPECEWPWDC